MRLISFGPSVEAAQVVRQRLGGAVHPAQRVAHVHARHRPLRRELERDGVRLEAPRQIAARAEHDRVVEVRLRAPGDGLARRVPERQIVGVVERVAARGDALEDRGRAASARRRPAGSRPAPRAPPQERRRTRWRAGSPTDGREVPEALGAHGRQDDGNVRDREVRDDDPHHRERATTRHQVDAAAGVASTTAGPPSRAARRRATRRHATNPDAPGTPGRAGPSPRRR